jgi:hypothetical protein
MAADERVLTDVLGTYVADPRNLDKGNFPSLGLEIARNPHFHLVTNCFFAHPDGKTDLTTNSIHHHGDMLLTTVTAFGPGYDHWLFSRPERARGEGDDTFAMELVAREQHARGHVAFVDAFVPHAVMFPERLTITYALWSDERPVRWQDRAKRLPIVRGNEAMLRDVVARLGLAKKLGVKQPTYLDYFPVDGGFEGMRDRIQFERGPNEDHLRCVFHVLQATGNEPVAARLARGGKAKNARLVRELAQTLDAGREVTARLSAALHSLPHMNFPAAAIERSLAKRRAA